MAVNIQFAHHFAFDEHRNHDLRLGLKRTGQVTGILADVIDYNGLAAGSRCPTNSLVQRNTGVRRHRAFKRAQDQPSSVLEAADMARKMVTQKPILLHRYASNAS